MATIPASQVARRRLSVAARRLGTSNPVDSIGGLLDRSFELPAGDPRYGRNSLAPGSMPIEHSFSELASGTLRLDMEPLGPLATPASRQQEVSREMRRLVQQNYGRQALAWFDERSEPWRSGRINGAARFGAWFGAGFDEGGLHEAKVYYELPDGGLDDLPPNLQHASRVAMACLPRLQPIFTSIAAGRAQGAQRIYFFHRGDLRLLDLEPLMNRLGIGHQLPGLLTAVGLILGGRFTLPEGSVVLALRETSRGMEMKLEILLPGIADPPREMHGLIQMHLAQRPDSQRALRNWIQAMSLDDGAETCGQISVVSVRVSPQVGSRLTLYFRPTGYERGPSRSRSVSDDPYATAVQ
ncbi:MAG: hypothetical protein ACM3PC_05245 [Deltaproteobacteria bacterium]